MHYILNIETATKNCSVSIAANGKTLVCKEISELGYSHAEKLHLFIQDVIQEAAISFSQLSAIAVSQGPGSYTGLRIGVSAAKGLSYALQIPLIAVDTLLALAHQVLKKDGLIVPMIDARRMEVYSAIFDFNKQKIREVQAEIISEDSFAAISEKIYFIGDSNEKVQSVLTKSNFVFLDAIQYPSAKEMSSISYQKYLEKDFVDVAYFEPYYLKDFLFAK
ncbi:tRNA (adenosine(37)-N6)-threonylcarbamoyltransferase complex dimerization subunit type 1 TsaB [Flavobacterium sp.]|jgi:tRNA threonylcarbamoyladenosine biosynthesis protein TsaB|uniref:tRNA (adenosine(37)-N6)-threonylcarbamoyltransferase complex dimerization subunit type 1 TsaB n=1 Tax=Flavobacterium sp. TaxID=239 RepID=UPI0037BE30E7